MRALLWIGLGFCAACAVGAYWFSGVLLLVCGICLLLISVITLLLFRKISPLRAAAFAVLGLGFGMIWFQVFSTVTLSEAVKADEKVAFIKAEITNYSYETNYGTAAEAETKLNGKTYRIKLYLNDTVSLEPGDLVSGRFLTQYTGPKGVREETFHSGNGIFLLGYQKDEIRIDHRNDASLRHAPARMRRAILKAIDSVFPGDTAPFAKALLLGDTTDISYETETCLSLSGIVHVVSVSGLHVSILLSLLFLLFGRRKIITPIAGAIFLLFAAAVTGFTPSIVRSCLMNGLILLALMVDRTYDPLTALAFALLVMLGVNPLAVTSVGLQLSAASVLGISLFAGGIGEWICSRFLWGTVKRRSLKHKLREWFATTCSVSLSATIMTAPLTALHFGMVSLVGILTNLLVLWIINGLFVGTILCVLLNLFWGGAARLLAAGLSWGIRFVLWTAGIFGTFPLAAVYTESPYIVWWLVFLYIMLGIFLIAKRKRVFQLSACALVTLAVALSFSWLEPRLDVYRITVIDVGQGQCVLLQSSGRTYMVDCGGDHGEQTADKAVAVLHAQGIFSLDGLILTHYDADHVGGARYLLSRVPVETLYLPVGPGEKQWEDDIRNSTDARCIWVDEDQQIRWQGATISVFASKSRETSNESSLCVLFQKENYDILITGDRNELGEKLLLTQNHIPRLDALVIGHHGSGSSTSEFLLDLTRPAVALISVGADNGYGHPDRNVLERLKHHGCIVRRTDLEGTIVIRR